MKIYISQIKPFLGDLSKNIELHKNEIQHAIVQKADIVIFPELSLTGYFLRDLVHDVALKSNSETIKLFESTSKRIGIIAGFVYEDENHQFFNAAGYFEAGSLKHLHRKVYLPNYTMFEESRYFAAGKSFETFDMFGSKTGILICEDALHLSSLYLYSLQGVKNLLIVSNSPARGFYSDRFYSQELWYNTIKFIANNLTVNTIFVNRVGVEDGVTFWGGSLAIDALGSEIGRCDLIREDNRIVEIKDETVRRSRILSPFYRDEDPELFLEFIRNKGIIK